MAHDNTLDDEELWKTSGRRRVTESTLAESRALDWADGNIYLSSVEKEALDKFVGEISDILNRIEILSRSRRLAIVHREAHALLGEAGASTVELRV